MDLKKDIVPEKHFRIFLMTLLSISVLGIFWLGIEEIQEFRIVFDEGAPVSSHKNTFTTGELRLSKTSIVQDGVTKNVRYVTVGHLTDSPSHEEISHVLKTSYGFSKIAGLAGHPSFLVTAENEGFWESQFYMEIGYRTGGFIILGILFLIIIQINFKHDKKLFVKRILQLLGGVYAVLMLGFFLEMLLYGRIMHFLNNEYYLGEALIGGTSQGLLSISVVLLFLITALQRGIGLQEEHDLTV